MPIPPLAEDSTHYTQIRQGEAAEQAYTKANTDLVETLIRQRAFVPASLVKKTAGQVLVAAVRTIRKAVDLRANLLGRMVDSHLLLYRIQQDMDGQTHYDQYHERVLRYAWKHVLSLPGRHDLKARQQTVATVTMARFFDKITDKRFRLTSTLDTYLFGIADRVVKEESRAPGQLLTQASPTDSDRISPFVDAQTVHFLAFSSQVIARQLLDMDHKCQQILFRFYGIDPVRVDAVQTIPDPSEGLPLEVFEAQFDVAIRQARNDTSLKLLAPEVGIAPSQISNRHLSCLDRVVLATVPLLFGDPSLAIPPRIRASLKASVDSARRRRSNH